MFLDSSLDNSLCDNHPTVVPMALSEIRACLQELRNLNHLPGLKAFIPEGSLSKLSLHQITKALSEPAFGIEDHKLEDTASIVVEEAQKIFAILVEISWECGLAEFIKNDIFDSRLPLELSKLVTIVPEVAVTFERVQWDYIAYRFRKGQYRKKLVDTQILPYVGQEKIGGGGCSVVYRVNIHRKHHQGIFKSGSKVSKNFLRLNVVRND